RIGPTRHGSIEFPALSTAGANVVQPVEVRPLVRTPIAQLTHKALLNRFTPAAVVIDRQQRVAYFHGHTERFLIHPPGEPTRELIAMTRDALRGAVRVVIHQAFLKNELSVSTAAVMTIDDAHCRVEVSASPLDQRSAPAYFLVTF